MREIYVDPEVYDEIRAQRGSGESENDVIRRILGLDDDDEADE